MADFSNIPIFVYRHRRLDNNQIFYIGIGKKNRPYSKHGRNNYWNKIVKKTTYIVEILKETNCWKEACELEQLLIQQYGRKDNNTGILCNMTDGGEGTLNTPISNKNKEKLRLNGYREKNILMLKENALKRKGKKFPRKLKVDNKKYILDLNTGIFYNTIREASFYNNLNEATLFNWLHNRRKNKSNLILI
jgi:hypothetical protein